MGGSFLPPVKGPNNMSWTTIEDPWAAMTRRVGVGRNAVGSVQKFPAFVSRPMGTTVVQTGAIAGTLASRS
jgi:hypothetical protein